MTTLTATFRPAAQAAARSATRRCSRLARYGVPALADALFVLLLLRVLQLGATSLFNDPGTGWHLRTGHDIVANGLVPRTDTYSYMRGGQPWVATQWLADAIMSLAYAVGGYPLLALGTAVLIAGLFRWIYRTQIAAGGWPTIGLMVTIVAACAASGHFLARPLVATSIGVPLSFWWASQYARGQIPARRLALLVPIAAVWCNLHPGVLGGIATVGLCGTGVLAEWVWRDRRNLAAKSLRRGLILIAAGTAMAAATLVNPYGLAWHAWVARLMGMKALSLYVTEWRPPGWTDPATIAALTLLGVVVVVTAARRKGITLAESLVIAFWAYYGLGSSRHLPLLAMVGAIQLGRVLADVRVRSPWLRRIGARLPLFTEDMRATEFRHAGGLASAVAVALLAASLGSGVTIPAIGVGAAGPSAQRYSPGAVAYLRLHPPIGGFFNDLNYGGTLIRDLPGLPVFADDRFDLYGEQFVTEYRHAVLEPEDHAAELLDLHRIQTVLIASHLPVCQWLRDSTEWSEEYNDAVAAVFIRRRCPEEDAL